MNDVTRVLLVDRMGSLHNRGGDTVQINAIAKYLTEQGYSVMITSDVREEKEPADLVLFFNLTNPYELLYQSAYIGTDTPYYVFPVYWDLDKEIPVDAYVGLLKKAAHLVPRSLMNILRWLKFIKAFSNRISINESLKFLFIRKNIKRFLSRAEYICVNSDAERDHLISKFTLEHVRDKVKVIYNGTDNLVDTDLEAPFSIPFSPYICCIGGIGPRKNQLNLIKAANMTDIPVVVVGQASKGEQAYYNKLIRLADRNIVFLGYVERKYVYHILKNAKAHIQPSYIETPGLVSLEALSIGCKIGVSNVGPVREYFGENASYCDPQNVDSIRTCLYELWNEENDTEKALLRTEYVHNRFEWANVLKPLGELVNKTIKLVR